jgi:hypothetical protein
MSKIGNEARLILSLAEEKVKNDKTALAKEIDYLAQTGNEKHSARQDWRTALEFGYRIGIEHYKETINRVVTRIEDR